MAFTAREVILVFRGQNYLSGAIRRAGMDVAGLSRMQQLQVRRATQMQATQRIQAAKAAAAAELASTRPGGARYKELEQARLQHNINLSQIQKERIDVQNRLDKAMERTMRAQAKANILTQAAYELGDKTNEQDRKLAQARAREAQQNLAYRQTEQMSAQMAIGLTEQRYQKELNQQGVLTARRRQLKAATDRLSGSVERYGVAEELAMLKLKQMDALIATESTQRIVDYGRKVEHISRVVQMLSLIATATFGYMASSFAKFQTQMTVAATQSTTLGHNTVAQVQANAQQIGKAIENMLLAGQTIAKPEELGQSIYDIFSGVTLHGNQQAQLRQGIALMKQFNQVVTANAGLVSMNDVTQAGITLMNDFGVSVGQMPAKLNLMQAAVRYGRMTMQQFLSTFNQAAPAAKGAGYSFEQMATAITFLSRKFPNIRFAATGYARLVEIIGRSRKAFEAHGIAVEKSNGQLLPLPVILANLAKRYPAVTKGARDLGDVLKEITGTSGTFQARRAGVFFLQDPQGLHTIIRQVTGDTNELQKSLDSVAKSFGVTWQEFLNQMRAIVLIVGEGAVRAFQKLAPPVRAIVHWFQSLSPHTQHLIGEMGTMIAVGALLTSTLTSIFGGLTAFVGSTYIFFKLRAALAAATAEMTALKVAEVEATDATIALGAAEGFAFPEVAIGV